MFPLKNSLVAFVLSAGFGAAWAAEPSLQKLLAARPAEQTEWGARYEHGEGVKADHRRAVQLYCAAAQKGHAPAQYQLGWLYANGRGVERDDALAAAWFRLAAARGETHARRMLELLGNPKRTKAHCVLPQTTEPAPLLAGIPTARPRDVDGWVRRLAPEYGLDPELVLAVIEAESGFNSAARSPKNAQGLMQLIPATAERFGVADVWDPVQNLRGGMAYLRWLLAYFQGDVRLTLAAYNAGEKAVERYRGVPPYRETRAYVAKIMSRYRYQVHPPVKAVVEPSTMVVSAAATAAGAAPR